MANITSVDYESIPGKTQQMKNLGADLMNIIQGVYTDVAGMHEVWYGKRYNELAVEFNKLIPQVNELIDLVWGEIPYTLEVIANNYAKADTGSAVCGADRVTPNKITELATPNDVGMRFVSSRVLEVKNTVTSKFKEANGKMNEFEGVYNSINWESEASNAFRSRFTKLKGEIINSFDTISNSFQRLMAQTENDIQST